MTKDELRKEATTTVQWKCTPMIDRPTFINGYITSAEPREKRIAELKAQIEKMKCCSMCKYYSMRFLPYFCIKNGTSPHCTSNCDKWEIKENDI